MLSFIEIGIPQSGPAFPSWIILSAADARSSALSKISAYALISPFRSFAVCKTLFVSSFEVNSFARNAFAALEIVSLEISIVISENLLHFKISVFGVGGIL